MTEYIYRDHLCCYNSFLCHINNVIFGSGYLDGNINTYYEDTWWNEAISTGYYTKVESLSSMNPNYECDGCISKIPLVFNFLEKIRSSSEFRKQTASFRNRRLLIR